MGHQGVTEGVLAALNQALLDHELVKVKLAQNVEDRAEAAQALAAGTDSQCAQTLGRTLLLFRHHPKKAKMVLPAPKRPVESAVVEEPAEDEPPVEDESE